MYGRRIARYLGWRDVVAEVAVLGWRDVVAEVALLQRLVSWRTYWFRVYLTECQ
jgi:hypothetical protein